MPRHFSLQIVHINNPSKLIQKFIQRKWIVKRHRICSSPWPTNFPVCDWCYIVSFLEFPLCVVCQCISEDFGH
ncbi:hypothetical protein JTE90_014262 [Oedothorax gibbosus]|uniref:Uncharacterized protein n=1 Tax=Oedothorax gibbosus TaxID=931172 RepID=A0AAV6UDG0_9ARAC|nr:hypothetical protein JTE90_014262 [Oedothorax gibbosus]